MTASRNVSECSHPHQPEMNSPVSFTDFADG
jgi:hypothetical protein